MIISSIANLTYLQPVPRNSKINMEFLLALILVFELICNFQIWKNFKIVSKYLCNLLTMVPKSKEEEKVNVSSALNAILQYSNSGTIVNKVIV